MSDPARTSRRATIEDFLAIPEEERFHELIGGEIVRKASPSGQHGATQATTSALLIPPFGRNPPSGGPGGWWFGTEIEIRFGDEICRPDVVGWRRSIVASRPRGTIIEIVTQWTCEILSQDRRNDLVRKKRIYHAHHVDHYWLLDPDQGTLAVNRWHPDGYLEVLSAERGQVVRAEPFDAIEISVGMLFGDETE